METIIVGVRAGKQKDDEILLPAQVSRLDVDKYMKDGKYTA